MTDDILEASLFEAKRVLVGQDAMIERLFVCWLARGHCVLEGAPGLAKTLAAETIAGILGGSFARLQFTPDLVPADELHAVYQDIEKDIGYKTEQREILRCFVGLGFVALLAAAAAAMIWNARFL
jgi:MoxR-like ATPase